jgi:hypothetical protein
MLNAGRPPPEAPKQKKKHACELLVYEVLRYYTMRP